MSKPDASRLIFGIQVLLNGTLFNTSARRIQLSQQNSRSIMMLNHLLAPCYHNNCARWSICQGLLGGEHFVCGLERWALGLRAMVLGLWVELIWRIGLWMMPMQLWRMLL